MSPNKIYLLGFTLLLLLIPSSQIKAYYGDGCEQYGSMAYASGGYCKCMSGYSFDTSITGSKYCTDSTTVCHSKLGYGSQYSYLKDSCECSYGYVLGSDILGKTSCISESEACTNTYGYHSRSTYGGKCECSYGYVFSGNKCVDGDTVCRDKSGLYSSYDDLSNSCKCDSGYTFDDQNQCVKKQNNVYFKLLDVNTDDKQAIIKSEYDYRRYLITYGSGCYSSSINRYKGRDLVVNLGTDFDVDAYDTIILQDDSVTCDIRTRERTYDDSLLHEDVPSTYYVPQYVPETQPNPSEVKGKPNPSAIVSFKGNSTEVVRASTTETEASSTTSTETSPQTKKSFWLQIVDWFKHWW